jgi:hypothetical protein
LRGQVNTFASDRQERKTPSPLRAAMSSGRESGLIVAPDRRGRYLLMQTQSAIKISWLTP